MKKKKKIKLSKLKKKAQAEFSKWIRKRDKGVCFTCGKVEDWKSMHAGHFRHRKLDFIPQNLHCQCIRCNTFMHGNLGVYAIKLDQVYGAGTAEKLIEQSSEIIKYSREELETLIMVYKESHERLS